MVKKNFDAKARLAIKICRMCQHQRFKEINKYSFKSLDNYLKYLVQYQYRL